MTYSTQLTAGLFGGMLFFIVSVGVAFAAPLSDPSDLSANAVSSSGVDLTWVDNSSREDNFRIERSTDGSNFSEVATVPPNSESYSDSGLDPVTTYYYRVRAYRSNGGGQYSGYSNIDSDTTFDTIPADPAGLTVTAALDDLELSWTDNASNEDGFKIERSTDGTNFSQIATVTPNVTTYDDLNLPLGTYYYRIRAYNTIGDSGYSNTDSDTVAPPAAPTALSTTATGTSITVFWIDNASDEDGFKLERSTDGVNFSQIDTVNPNSGFYLDGPLTDGTYYYRVRAYNVLGNSSYSNTDSATIVTVPAAPSALGTSVTDDDVALSWTDNASNEDGFKIERSTDGTNFSQIATVTPNVTTYDDLNLPDDIYYYRVRTYNTAGDSGYSNVATATVDTTPTAPTALTATASGTSISISWTDNASDEDGFKIERSTDGTNFSQIDTVNANVTFYSDGPLTDGTYYYRVRSYNTSGNSSYTNIATATVVTVPNAPTGLTASLAMGTSTAIMVTWTDTADNETAYSLERSTDGSNFSVWATLPANYSAYYDAAVFSGNTYYYRVRATNSAGNSAYSNTDSETI